MENKMSREIIISKFEAYPFELEECEYSGFPKAICQLTIDVKNRTISYNQISGSELPVFVVLAIMGTNKHWSKIVAEEADIEDERFLMDKFGSNGNVTESYLAHTGENGLPVIDRCIARYETLLGGILDFTLSSLEYSLFIRQNIQLELSGRKTKLHRLMKKYGFKYIK